MSESEHDDDGIKEADEWIENNNNYNININDDVTITNNNFWIGIPPMIPSINKDKYEDRKNVQLWLDSLALQVDKETLLQSSRPSSIPLYKRNYQDVVQEKDLFYKTVFESLLSADKESNDKICDHISSHHIHSVPVTIFWPKSLSSISNKQPSLEHIQRACIHCHGGGWLFGDSKHQAADRLLKMSKTINAPVISIEYRMGPNNPFPNALQDVESVLHWFLMLPSKCRLVLSGESAGAQLIMLAVLRILRIHYKKDDRASTDAMICGCIAALNLVYGVYDLSGTYLLQSDGDKSAPLSGKELQWMMELHKPPLFKPTSPDISPLYDDLSTKNDNLPPALFMVGTADPLLDDTILMSSKYCYHAQRYNYDNENYITTQLAIYAGGQHGIGHFGMQEHITLGQKARKYTEEFLAFHLNKANTQSSSHRS